MTGSERHTSACTAPETVQVGWVTPLRTRFLKTSTRSHFRLTGLLLLSLSTRPFARWSACCLVADGSCASLVFDSRFMPPLGAAGASACLCVVCFISSISSSLAVAASFPRTNPLFSSVAPLRSVLFSLRITLSDTCRAASAYRSRRLFRSLLRSATAASPMISHCTATLTSSRRAIPCCRSTTGMSVGGRR